MKGNKNSLGLKNIDLLEQKTKVFAEQEVYYNSSRKLLCLIPYLAEDMTKRKPNIRVPRSRKQASENTSYTSCSSPPIYYSCRDKHSYIQDSMGV